MPLVPPADIIRKRRDWLQYCESKLVGGSTLPKNFRYLVSHYFPFVGIYLYTACVEAWKIVVVVWKIVLKINEALKSRFQKGLMLELVDNLKLSRTRVATISKNTGGRLKIKYNDWGEFYCHERSDLIHPVGWSVTVGHSIQASDEYKRMSALKYANNSHDPLTECTIDMFRAHTSQPALTFRPNMKLEAIDPLNLATICVASVKRVLNDNFLMVKMDTYEHDDELTGLFCYHQSSSSIFPAGFCQANQLELQTPYSKHTYI